MMKKRMIELVLAGLAVAVGGTALLPSRLSARREVCGICENWAEGLGWPIHRFGSMSNDLYTPPFHTEFQERHCQGDHSGCGNTLLDLRGGIERIEYLAARGDWVGLRELMDAVPSVGYNASRNAIQVEECTHDIVATIELAPSATGGLGVARQLRWRRGGVVNARQ